MSYRVSIFEVSQWYWCKFKVLVYSHTYKYTLRQWLFTCIWPPDQTTLPFMKSTKVRLLVSGSKDLQMEVKMNIFSSLHLSGRHSQVCLMKCFLVACCDLIPSQIKCLLAKNILVYITGTRDKIGNSIWADDTGTVTSNSVVLLLTLKDVV